MIDPGTKNGEIRFGPFSWSRLEFSSIVFNPPIPEPTETPILFGSYDELFISESFIQSIAAAIPYWIKGSNLLISFLSRYCSGSKFLIVAANLVSLLLVSKEVISETPLCPFRIELQTCSILFSNHFLEKSQFRIFRPKTELTSKL